MIVINVELGRTCFKEIAAGPHVHVDKLFTQVPARLECARERVIHKSFIFNGFGSRENIFVGFRHVDTSGVQNVFAVK